MDYTIWLGTGLRLGDIESIRVFDIDFEKSSVTTRSKKTRKSMGSRPVPVPIMAELKKYVSGRTDRVTEKIRKCLCRKDNIVLSKLCSAYKSVFLRSKYTAYVEQD